MAPDWERERPKRLWDPARRLLRSIRRYQAARANSRRLAAKYWVLQHRFWAVVTGAEIPINCRIGGGLMLPHPNGIVIHPATIVGANCLIMHQVTLGTNGAGGAPVVGDGVDFGPGATVLGAIGIGDRAMIGANAVVLRDVAADTVIVGNPARPLETTATETRARLEARRGALADAPDPRP